MIQCAFVSRGRGLQTASVIALSLTSFLGGNSLGWYTAVAETMNDTYSGDEASWIAAIMAPMALAGALLSGVAVTYLGPRKSCLAMGIPNIVGWAFLLFPTTLWSAIIGRSLCGIAAGSAMALAPSYNTDILEDSLRGFLGSVFVVSLNLGILVTYGLGGFLNPFGVAMFSGVISLLFMIAFFPCPESPRHLFAIGRDEAAEETLRRLRNNDDIAKEIAAVRTAAIKPSDGSKTSIVDLVRGRAAILATIISLGVLTIQQGSGIAVVQTYAADIFKMSGGSLSPIESSCIVGAFQLMGSAVGSALLDRTGRRILMLVSCFFMAVSQIVLGFAFFEDKILPKWVPVVTLSAYMVTYTVGAGVAPLVIAAEVFAPRIKGMACSIVVAYAALVAFVETKIFLALSLQIGPHGVFWLFGAVSAIGFVFVWFVLPETAGRSSASIQAQLSGKKEVMEKYTLNMK